MPMTLAELVERYTDLRNLNPKTVSLYTQLLLRLEQHLGHVPTVDDLDDLVISRYLRLRAQQIVRGHIIAPATVRRDRTMLQAVWNLAARKRWAKDFPELPRIRVPVSIPTGKAYTHDDVQLLLRRAMHRKGVTGGRPSAWWWTTMLWMLYCTGERISALLECRWAQVDLDRRRILFLAATRKGQTRDLERDFVAELATMMRPQRGQPNELVWQWDRQQKTSLWNSLQMLCRLAGVQYRGFHGFRRSRASYAALQGGRAAATQVLDHSNSRLQEVYVDPRICPSEESSVDVMPRIDLS
jgi:integrase